MIRLRDAGKSRALTRFHNTALSANIRLLRSPPELSLLTALSGNLSRGLPAYMDKRCQSRHPEQDPHQ